MKRLTLHILLAILVLLPLSARAFNIPLLHNFTALEYQAHNVNYDIYVDNDGIVYVANFEGLLYYDKANWHIIHTPGITRLTSLNCDQEGRIWVGGYNFLGYIETDSKGALQLHAVDTSNKSGEIRAAEESKPKELMFEDSISVSIVDGNGLIVIDKDGSTICHLTEENGLCDNNVRNISYDGHGTLWGATDKGIFALAIPSKYSQLTAIQGLKGDITDIEELDSTIFVSTTKGVYKYDKDNLTPVQGITHNCIQLYQTGNSLLAATGLGVYSIFKDGQARLLSQESALSVMGTPDRFYCGELSRVMLYTNGQPSIVSEMENVVDIHQDNNQCLWMQDIYGHIWKKQKSEGRFSLASDGQTMATMIIKDGNVNIVSSTDTIDYPLFTITDKMGYTWLTNYEGRHLYAVKDGKRIEAFTEELEPLANYSIKALYHQKGKLWIGGEFGLITVGHNYYDASFDTKPELHIRSIILNADSVVWGGFGQMPNPLPTFDSHSRNISISYALAYPALAGETLYRHRLNDGQWSAWTNKTTAAFQNLAYGDYVFEVQAQDAFGRITETSAIEFSIQYPFYLGWYMQLLYLFIIGLIVYAFAKWRLRRLEQEKVRLESIVQQRTSEVIQQKNEIEEKSVRLQSALDELAQTQNELIRQEKMATAGKLTQGLIDRILNPMNYINNFSKLSCGLLKDLKANIEDEKGNMDQESLDDTLDIIEMLDQNLQKVEQHGLNTTRTLKAMEEILKDRTGGKIQMDLRTVLKQDEEMLGNYFKEKIEKFGVRAKFSMPETEVCINGNPELMSMTIMSILGNAMYAVEKKATRQQYTPEIAVTLTQDEANACITIRDNGIGIESAIIDKIYDPFFTTKPTGEAAGIGLYLSHEVIHDHGGNINVKSEKDQYTTITISLPILQK